MDILLVNPLARCGEMSAYPLGLLYLDEYLNRKGLKCSIYDRNARKYHDGMCDADIDTELLRVIDEQKPSFVGITMMTVHFFDARHTADLIKQRFPEIILITGGIHSTFEPERTLRQIPGADIAVRGPGEAILEALIAGSPLETIPNIVFREQDNRLHTTLLAKQERTGFKKLAYDHDVIQSYWKHEQSMTTGMQISGMTLMITSQGCPGKCTFCVDDRFLGGGFFESDDQVLDEVELLYHQYNRKAFFFLDRIFRLSSPNIMAFCQRKIERGLEQIPWSTTIRADQADENLAAWMKKAGCFQVYLGFESGSQRVLDMLQKGSTVEQNAIADRIFNEHDILVQGSFIYGLPTQTAEEMNDNIRLFDRMNAFDSSCNQFLPSPGSVLYAQLVEQKVLDPDDDRTWDRTVDLNAPLSPERNYSPVPFPEYEEIYHRHSQHIANVCNERRSFLINKYGLNHIFS